MTMTGTTDAVRKEIVVGAPVERAWAVFTERFDTWWPRSHSIGAAPMAAAVVEGREGGRWYERGEDGSECEWGRVLAWDPPRRLVLSWHIDATWTSDPDPAHASEVEVRFTPEGDGTRVELEHRGFERHQEGGDAVRAQVAAEGGWPSLLEGFAKVV